MRHRDSWNLLFLTVSISKSSTVELSTGPQGATVLSDWQIFIIGAALVLTCAGVETRLPLVVVEESARLRYRLDVRRPLPRVA